jgi:hypothetical protein
MHTGIIPIVEHKDDMKAEHIAFGYSNLYSHLTTTGWILNTPDMGTGLQTRDLMVNFKIPEATV